MFALNKSVSKLRKLKDKEKNETDGKEKKKVKRKRNKKSTDVQTDDILTPGLVVLRNIPHGFYEPQMREYFKQFGRVNRLRLSRSRKTKKSRGYAYIEFECDDVAKIVAETMNNYLMFESLLKCKYILPEDVPPNVFNTRPLAIDSITRHKWHVNRSRSVEDEINLVKKRLHSIRKVEQKLKDMGIDFKCKIVNEPENLHEFDKVKVLADKSDDEDDGDEESVRIPVIKKSSKNKMTKITKKNKELSVMTIKPKAETPMKRRKLKLQKVHDSSKDDEQIVQTPTIKKADKGEKRKMKSPKTETSLKKKKAKSLKLSVADVDNDEEVTPTIKKSKKSKLEKRTLLNKAVKSKAGGSEKKRDKSHEKYLAKLKKSKRASL